MKKIEKVSTWLNGEQKEASILKAIISQDNLETSCTFYYQLCEGQHDLEETPLVVGSVLVQGNINLNGEEYIAWDGSNESAYTFIANKLNLIIV